MKVPLCWDGESEFEEANNNNVQEQDEKNQFEDYILWTQKATKFFIQTLCMITCGNVIYQAFANVMKKATSASTAIKEHDYEKLQTLLGWLPLEVVKKTLNQNKRGKTVRHHYLILNNKRKKDLIDIKSMFAV